MKRNLKKLQNFPTSKNCQKKGNTKQMKEMTRKRKNKPQQIPFLIGNRLDNCPRDFRIGKTAEREIVMKFD